MGNQGLSPWLIGLFAIGLQALTFGSPLAQTTDRQPRTLFDPVQTPVEPVRKPFKTVEVNPLAPPGLGELALPPERLSAGNRTSPKLSIAPWGPQSIDWIEPALQGRSLPVADPDLRAIVRHILIQPGPSGSGETTLLARVRALIAIGDFASARRLMARHPNWVDNSAAARLMIDAAMLDQGLDAACAIMDQLDEKPSTTQLVCLWHRGDHSRLALNVRLNAERGARLPKFIQDVVTSSDRGAPVVVPAYVADPVTLSLLRLVPVQVTGDIENPAILQALSANASLSAEQRIDLSERVAVAGLIEPSDLIDRYRSLADATGDDYALKSPTSRARFIKNYDQEAIPFARLTLMANAWRTLFEPDLKPVLAPAFASLAREFLPVPDFAPMAETIAEILLLSGDLEAGLSWLRLRGDQADTGFGSVDAAMIDALANGAAGAGLPLGEPESLFAWLFDALWAAGDDRMLAQLLRRDQGQTAPPFAAWILADQAVASSDQRLGLLSLINLVRGDPRGAAPIAGWRFYRGLASLGYRPQARAWAVRHLITEAEGRP